VFLGALPNFWPLEQIKQRAVLQNLGVSKDVREEASAIRKEISVRDLKPTKQELVNTRRFMKRIKGLEVPVVHTQRERQKSIKQLRKLIAVCMKHAKAANTVPHKLKWYRISGYVFQVLNSYLAGFDKHQITKDLEELKRLVSAELAKRDKEDKARFREASSARAQST